MVSTDAPLADPGWAEPPVCTLFNTGTSSGGSCGARDALRNPHDILTKQLLCCRSSRRARGAFNNLSALFHSSTTGSKNTGKHGLLQVLCIPFLSLIYFYSKMKIKQRGISEVCRSCHWSAWIIVWRNSATRVNDETVKASKCTRTDSDSGNQWIVLLKHFWFSRTWDSCASVISIALIQDASTSLLCDFKRHQSSLRRRMEESHLMQTLVGVTLAGHPVALPVPHDGTDARNKQDIGDILHQIMTITDQSLDEAQAKLVLQWHFTMLFMVAQFINNNKVYLQAASHYTFYSDEYLSVWF